MEPEYKGMASFRTQFNSKLHVAFGVLLIITMAIAWYFFDTLQWYQRDLQKIAHANEVLHSYEDLSNLTYQKLQAMTDAVLSGSEGYLLPDDDGVRALRDALTRVRQGIADIAALGGGDIAGQELESLVEVERVLENIIRAGDAINQALAENRSRDAIAEITRLRSDGTASHFSSLVDQSIFEQQQLVRGAHEETVALASYINRLLPVLMTVTVVLTFIFVALVSRSLTRSIKTLHDGVAEFTGGNLKHRIPDISEKEFHELGEAFNTMAQELSGHRSGLRDANVKLEGMIEERTRALKESNEKLAEVDETRRKLLADISHEFRTPLTVIRGESEIALRSRNATKADYRDSLERIIQQADHTTRLVDDLLFIARADAGEPRLDMGLVTIGSLLDEVCTNFKAKGESKRVKIRMKGQKAKAEVRGDIGRLRQVFGILLDNAMRYSNENSTIDVELTVSRNDASVSVRDHGIGLTEEEAAQAFERFFRGAQAEGHARGTGLGLPVAKAIVEAHKGTISLTGEPGKGAVATVVLPIENTLRVVA